MANRGLKSSEKQLETTLHFGRMFYNLYSGDENYILEISIGTSLDGMKLPLEVFYNSLDSSLDSGFGNGVKSSLYADFTLSGTEIIQVKADGASYSYTYSDGKYYINEDSSYIVYEDNTFKLHVDGYVYEYNGNSYHLFSKITYPDGRSLWTDADSSVTDVVYRSIYGKAFRITFSSGLTAFQFYDPENENTLVSTIRIYQNNHDVYRIQYNYGNSTLSDTSYRHLYFYKNGNTLELSDHVSKKKSILSMDSTSHVFSIEDGNMTDTMNTVYTISESGDITTVEDKYGNISTYHFKDGIPSYECDGHGYYQAYTLTNGLVSWKGEPFIPLKLNGENQLSGLPEISSGLSFTESPESSITSLGLESYQVTGSGTLTFTLNTEINTLTRRNVFSFMKKLSGSLTLKLQFGYGTPFTLTETQSGLLSLDGYATSVASFLKVEMIFTGFNGYVSYPVLTDHFGEYYTYDSRNRITEILGRYRTLTYTYDAYGRVMSESDGTTRRQMSYDGTTNLVTQEHVYYLNTEVKTIRNTYTKNNTKITKMESVSGTDVLRRNRVLYDTYGRILITGHDEDENVLYTYSNGRLYSVTDENDTETLRTYDSETGLLSKIKYVNENLSLNYQYDEDLRLSSSVIQNEISSLSYTSLRYTYDSLNRITSLTSDGHELENYTYNGNDQLTRLQNERTVKQYAYSEDNLTEADDITISYDSYNRISSLMKGGEYEIYTYDKEDRIIRKLTDTHEVRYRYDEDDNLIMKRTILNNTNLYQAMGQDILQRKKYTLLYKTDTSFTVYPLNTSVSSLSLDSEDEPVFYNGSHVRRNTVASSFVYDESLERHVYHRVNHVSLVLPTDFSTEGTISFRIRKGSISTAETIWELKNNETSFLKLTIDTNSLFHLSLFGTELSGGMTLSSGYHTIVVSYSSDNGYTIKLYVDGVSTEYTSVNTTTVSNPSLHIFGSFDGYGEMLALKNQYYSSYSSILQNLSISITEDEITYQEDGNPVSRIFYSNNLCKYEDELYYHTYSVGDEEEEDPTYYSTDEVLTERMITSGSTTGYLYTYSNGNITRIKKNGVTDRTFTYSSLGYLLTENERSYTYDENGNITGNGDSTFTYDSTYKTKIIGPNVSYDSMTGFYPTGILGATLTYSGDKLSTHTKNGVTTTYTYDMLGLRRSKSTNGVTTQFIYDGDKLIGLVHPSYSIYFLYHGDDLYGFLYEGDVYYYERNILGEILGIVDSSGTVISTYSYTAYGEITSVSGNSLGLLNPMRYKGYFYDEESGYYYCKSRYYVPIVGRWLTPDKVKYLDNSVICGYNPFIYCNNNPIMYVDEDGNMPEWLKTGCVVGAALITVAAITAITVATGGTAAPVLIGAGIGAGVSASVSVVGQLISTGTMNWVTLVTDLAIGAVSGAFGGSTLGLWGMTISGVGTGFVGSILGDFALGNDINYGAAVLSGLLSGAIGFIGGAGAQFGKTSGVVKFRLRLNTIHEKGIAGRYLLNTEKYLSREKNKLILLANKTIFKSIPYTIFSTIIDYVI